ncbi:AsmA family protein [Agitococcus lubricus]|uniref:Uncharacterized protein involved in outer membrane biogenesis n=1 Tax=Agitococcus lubricus TaxID=1077255 RepID=A0A2T5IUH5_9GAMM|nr:AsmA family protein [Agitococcus lubricus]PTQ87546.1 uncharacterized protein involved in outer membrane biogenesis [Agitococcus lubricus]
MSQVSKIALWSVGSTVAVVVGLAAFVVAVVDPNDYKQEIYRIVKDKTDMDLAINDPIEWQLWPEIGLKLGKTTLADNASQHTLVAINQASVSIQVMPLLSKQIAIDAVSLDGAQVNFIQYANGTTSWDKMLNKLKSQPEEKSEKIAFNIQLLDINNSALHVKDEKTNMEAQLDKLLVHATNIDLDKAFPVRLKFSYQQKDGQGKTLIADNDLNATVQLDTEAQRYELKGLMVRSHLEGTLLPAPIIADLQADIRADVKQQKHQVDGMKLVVDYQDPSLKSPARMEMQANIAADLAQQAVTMKGLQVSASYPQVGLSAPATLKLVANDVQTQLNSQQLSLPTVQIEASYPAANLKSPATLKLNTAVNADLKQQIVRLSAISADANYPDPARPAPITARLTGMIEANLATGALNFSPLDLVASLSDKAFPKVMPIHLTAPITANWKEGKVALNGFNLDALSINSKGQLAIALPALASTAAVKPAMTQGMSVTGQISTSSFDARQLMQTLGMAAPAMTDSNTLKRVSVSTQLTGTDNSMLLKGMKLQLDESTLTGDAGLSDIKQKKVYARLTVDKINVDRYLPPADPNAKPSTAGLLPVDLLKQQNLDVALTIGQLTAVKYPIKQFQVASTAQGGVVQVSKLSGSIYNGSFNLPTTIDVRGKEPVLSVSPSLQQIDIANIIQQFTKKDVFAGKASYQGKLNLVGNSTQAWLNSVNGNSSLKFENGILKGVNMMQLVMTEMGKYQALLPMVTGKDANTLVSKQNDTEIATFLGEADIKNGTVQTNALNADLKKAKMEGNGSFNLATMEADYSFKFNLDKAAVGEKYAKYPIPIRCKGKLTSPASLCSVDSKAVRDMATTALLESEKVQKLKSEAEAKAKQKIDEAAQKANVKLSEEGQKATEQLNNKLNEQLQKLFKP